MIQVQDLAISLGGKSILSGVNLRLEPGQSVALVGPNGAGKSTLIRAMLGLIRPSEGTVRWRGIEVHKLRGQDRRRPWPGWPSTG